MSRHERYGTRSLVYSRWHRFYMGDGEPMIDLDGIEYCAKPGCSTPLILVETARDVGQSIKATTVLQRLSERSGVMAICVLFRPSNPGGEECACTPREVNPACDHGIDRFRVKRVWPDPQKKFTTITPTEYVDRLRAIRLNHIEDQHTDWSSTAAGVVS